MDTTRTVPPRDVGWADDIPNDMPVTLTLSAREWRAIDSHADLVALAFNERDDHGHFVNQLRVKVQTGVLVAYHAWRDDRDALPRSVDRLKESIQHLDDALEQSDKARDRLRRLRDA